MRKQKMSSPRKFTEEFKTEAVKVALSSDQSYAATAKDLGLSKTTLYQWINNNMNYKVSKQKSPSSTLQGLEEENRKLKKALKRVEMERDILKKATVFFANQEA